MFEKVPTGVSLDVKDKRRLEAAIIAATRKGHGRYALTSRVVVRK